MSAQAIRVEKIQDKQMSFSEVVGKLARVKIAPIESFQSKIINGDVLEAKADSIYYYNKTTYYPILKEAITDKNTVYQWRRQYVRENKSNVCPTLAANMGTGGHNVPLVLDNQDIRKLTVSVQDFKASLIPLFCQAICQSRHFINKWEIV
jgi:hypothetical protein